MDVKEKLKKSISEKLENIFQQQQESDWGIDISVFSL